MANDNKYLIKICVYPLPKNQSVDLTAFVLMQQDSLTRHSASRLHEPGWSALIVRAPSSAPSQRVPRVTGVGIGSEMGNTGDKGVYGSRTHFLETMGRNIFQSPSKALRACWHDHFSAGSMASKPIHNIRLNQPGKYQLRYQLIFASDICTADYRNHRRDIYWRFTTRQ